MVNHPDGLKGFDVGAFGPQTLNGRHSADAIKKLLIQGASHPEKLHVRHRRKRLDPQANPVPTLPRVFPGAIEEESGTAIVGVGGFDGRRRPRLARAVVPKPLFLVTFCQFVHVQAGPTCICAAVPPQAGDAALLRNAGNLHARRARSRAQRGTANGICSPTGAAEQRPRWPNPDGDNER